MNERLREKLLDQQRELRNPCNGCPGEDCACCEYKENKTEPEIDIDEYLSRS